MNSQLLARLLDESAALHHHLCPRQVLGVRMGLYAGELLGLEVPQKDKLLLAIVESDGCALDGIAVATNCWPGRRTMRIEDYGKVAATFIDTENGRAVRIVPAPGCRSKALDYAPDARGKWQGQLNGYQAMPAEELFLTGEVELTVPVSQVLGAAKMTVICAGCGEEVINGREVYAEKRPYCMACMGTAYYVRSVSEPLAAYQEYRYMEQAFLENDACSTG